MLYKLSLISLDIIVKCGVIQEKLIRSISFTFITNIEFWLRWKMVRYEKFSVYIRVDYSNCDRWQKNDIQGKITF